MISVGFPLGESCHEVTDERTPHVKIDFRAKVLPHLDKRTVCDIISMIVYRRIVSSHLAEYLFAYIV